MTKKLRFVVSLAFLATAFLPAHGQITLNSSSFPIPGLKVGHAWAYTLASAGGGSGPSQVYDFSNISPLYHDSVHYFPASVTPWYSYHPGTQVVLVENADNLTYVYYCKLTPHAYIRTGLTLIGDFGQGTDTVHGNYSDPDTLLSDAYTYGYSHTELATGTIPNLLPFANYQQKTRREIFADGWGSLTTPLNNYPQVLRVRAAEYRYDTVFYFGSPVYTYADTQYFYRFYATGTGHPVVTAHTDASWQMQYLEYIFTPPVVTGCTDQSAANFNPLATLSDGSCYYCNFTASISSDTTICPGSSILLSATGGSTYLWSDSSTTASIMVNPSASSQYSVLVGNGSGCYTLVATDVWVADSADAKFWTDSGVYSTDDNILFVNLSTQSQWYYWDFDDVINGNSQLEHPYHMYSSPGQKNVKLIAGNLCFSDTALRILFIDDASGTKDSEILQTFWASPNPGTDRLELSGFGIGDVYSDIIATDLSGRRHMIGRRGSNTTGNALVLGVSQLAPGFYIFDFEVNGKTIRLKWMKAK